MQPHQPDATPWDQHSPTVHAVATHLVEEGHDAWVADDGDGAYVGLRVLDHPHDPASYYTAAPGPRGTAGEWVWTHVIGGVGANQGGYVCQPGTSTPLLGAHTAAAELGTALRTLSDTVIDVPFSENLLDPVNTRWYEVGTAAPGPEPDPDAHSQSWGPETDPQGWW